MLMMMLMIMLIRRMVMMKRRRDRKDDDDHLNTENERFTPPLPSPQRIISVFDFPFQAGLISDDGYATLVTMRAKSEALKADDLIAAGGNTTLTLTPGGKHHGVTHTTARAFIRTHKNMRWYQLLTYH
jgi:hypothetical protein